MSLAGNRLGTMACPAPATWQAAPPSFRRPAGEPRAADASRSRDRSGNRVCRTGETRRPCIVQRRTSLHPVSVPLFSTTHPAEAPQDCPLFPTLWHSICSKRGQKVAASRQPLDRSGRVSCMFADMHIVPLRIPGGTQRAVHRLREHMIRSARHGTVPPLPRPAAMAGTPAGDGVAGGIAGDRGAQAVCGPIPHADASALSF